MATTPKTVKKTTSPSATKTAVKKPVAAKAAAPKKAVAAPKTTAAASQPAAKRSAASNANITPEQYYCMIAEAAYYHAEKHGFMGDPVQEWITAEAEIKALVSGK